MNSTTAVPTAPVAAESKRTPLLIDTDVHENLRSKMDLLPYMDDYWQHYMNTYQFDRGPTTPSGWPYTAMLVTRGRAEWTNEDGSVATDIAKFDTDLFKGEGVTHALMNGQFYPSFMKGNFEFATALARAYNDWQFDQWIEKDERLYGSIQVIAQDPKVAAEEIDRVGAHPRAVQVFLPLTHDRQYGEPKYHPIYEAAVRNDLVVSMHHLNSTETLFGYPRYWLEWHTMTAPASAMNQLMSFIANGVFDKFPELKLVLLETGVGWLNWFMWRADSQYKELRMEVPWVKRLPSEHVRDNVRLSTQPMGDTAPRDFAELVEMTDTKGNFMFSSDYPHFDADSINVLDRLPDDLRTAICYENAIATYPRLAGLGS
jgi:predicted TIM-barrel fold metal-dependent hydrolase